MRRPYLSLLPACLLCVVGVCALEYSGECCDGFVTFALSSNTDTSIVDFYIEEVLAILPIFVAETCRSWFRRYVCIAAYTSFASENTTMCSSVCSNILDDCVGLIDLIASDFQYELEVCAAKAVTHNCTSGEADAYNSNDKTICPYYTVLPDVPDPTYALVPSGCVFQCPGALFNEEFNLNDRIYHVQNPMCFLAGLFVAIRYGLRLRDQNRKAAGSGARASLHQASVLPIFMFCVGCVTCAGVNILVLLTGGYKKMICDDTNSRFSASPPLCIIQGSCIALSMLWTSLWSLVIGFELYAKACLKNSECNLSKLRPWYLHFTVAYILVLGVPAICLGNVETYIIETAPYCFFNLAGVRLSTLLLFWIPLIVNVLGGATLMIFVLFKVRYQTGFIPNSPKTHVVAVPNSWWSRAQRESSSTKWKEAVTRKLICFVLIYDLAMLFIIASNFTVMLTSTKFYDRIAPFVECLFIKSWSSKEGGLACGHPSSLPVTPLPMLTTLNIVMSGYGLIPFLIFGWSVPCAKKQKISSAYSSANNSRVTSRLAVAVSQVLRVTAGNAKADRVTEGEAQPASGELTPSHLPELTLLAPKVEALEELRDGETFYHVNPSPRTTVSRTQAV